LIKIFSCQKSKKISKVLKIRLLRERHPFPYSRIEGKIAEIEDLGRKRFNA